MNKYNFKNRIAVVTGGAQGFGLAITKRIIQSDGKVVIWDIDKEAIENAKRTGFGLVAVKKSGHFGLSSFYAEQAVKKNLIVFCFTNAPPAIAPYGARKSLFGTNPICFGAPVGKVPFILDTSTSIINRGKINSIIMAGIKNNPGTPKPSIH